MHHERAKYLIACSSVLLLLGWGCSGSKRTVDVTAPAGQKVTVEMKASNYAFDPGVVVARRGDILIFQVTNVSGEKHNLTVKDPAGKILQSVDLPGHQTTTVELPLGTTGVYPFYCDIDLHATLGMKGRIEVR